MTNQNTIVVTLVALIAMVGLLSSGATGAASWRMPDGMRADQELGLTLGSRAAEIASTAESQQEQACSYACQDLCPASPKWTREMFQKTEESECPDYCKIRCQSILREEIRPGYGRT